MKIIYFYILIFCSFFIANAQNENKKIIFSENEEYVLIDYNEKMTFYESNETRECSFDNYLFLISKDENHSIIEHRDSIYFEIHGNKKKTKNIDSIFCIKNSIQYKNKDTSYYANYISDKMSKENFYKKYELNQVGKLINNEIKYKIENIRDTIFNYSPDRDIIKPYKIDAKIFTLKLYHKGKMLKKIDLELIFIIEYLEEIYININKLKKENEKVFISFMKDLKKELDLCIKNQIVNNKIIDFIIYNHQKKYYIDFGYNYFQVKSLELPEKFYTEKAFENGKLKISTSVFYHAVSSRSSFRSLYISD